MDDLYNSYTGDNERKAETAEQPEVTAPAAEEINAEEQKTDMQKAAAPYAPSGAYYNTYRNSYGDGYGNYYNNRYANPYAGNNPNAGGYPNMNQGPNPEQMQSGPQKKPNGFVRFLKVVAAAVVFGLVASGTFIGVNLIYNEMNPQQAVVIGDTEPTRPAEQILASPLISSSYIEGTSVSDLVEGAMPFTVSINCTFTTSSWFGQYESTGSGSGIIVGKNDTELLIVTNNHVIDGATSVTAVLADGSETNALVKGTSASTDLAVIAVKLADLSEETMNAIRIATLGDSDGVKVGEMVVAIGNALGYGQSVTVGYVSAKDRVVEVDGVTMTLLQTDAAINPGNSGGALLNQRGEVIGINSVKYADKDVEGMGFAIPVSSVRDIIQGLMNSLSADEKGYIGVYINDITEEVAAYYRWPVGIYVVDFTENSAAKEAGIMIGDIITGINGMTILTSEEMIERVTSYPHGTTVTVTLQRNIDGEYVEMEIDVVLRQSAEYSTGSEEEEDTTIPEWPVQPRR